jgi:PilZ domain
MERRFIQRKEIRLPCALEIAGLTPLHGQTRDISGEGVALRIPHLSVPGLRHPKLGDTGMLTLSTPPRSMARHSLKIPCRVAHITGNVVGLQINAAALPAHQRETFSSILG